MNEFKVFTFDKKKDFLAKAKQNKSKRAEDAKYTTNILLLQKNLRAYLTSTRHAGPQYPLLIRSADQVQKNRRFVERLWDCLEMQPDLLKKRVLTLTIRSLQLDMPLEIKIPSLLASLSSIKQKEKISLDQNHFLFLIEHYFSALAKSNVASKLFKCSSFRSALKTYMKGDVHRCIWVIYNLTSLELMNDTIGLFVPSYIPLTQKEVIRQEESLQDVHTSYDRIFELVEEVIRKNENDDVLAIVLAIMIERLKGKYIQTVLQKYKIQESLYLSPEFKEEVNQLLMEKRQLKELENRLIPLACLLGHFLEKFYKCQTNKIDHFLNIVIEISKMNQSFAALKLSNKEFFSLIQKLDAKFFMNKAERDMKLNEAFFIILILKSYIQSLNDMQFMSTFKFDTDSLKESIRKYLIRFMKNVCMINETNSDLVEELINNSITFMSNLYNKIFRTNLLSTTVFEDSSMVVLAYGNHVNKYSSYFKELKKIVNRMPCLLPIQTRFLMFRSVVQESRAQSHFFNEPEGHIVIKRGREFQDAFDRFFGHDIRRPIKVKFINQYGLQERGADVGGLTKQFLNRVFKVAFDPNTGLFIENSKKELMPNPIFKAIQNDSRKAQQYQFVGQLLGKSLYENIMLGIKFAGPFLNLLINKKNSFDDLLSIDPELYRSLAYIVGMEEGVQQLGLTFQYTDDATLEVVDLVSHGQKIAVNDGNKMQYINLLINYKVNRSLERQTYFIRRGLKRVINQSWITMFSYAQLNYLISGTGKIDVRDWIAHTHYHGKQSQTCHEYIQMFWQIVYAMTEEEKSLLLKFVTSCQRPSFLGFKDLDPPFTLVIGVDKEDLPVAHTCSNVLELPQYKSKQILKQKLLYAIKSGAGFEFA